jgi:hypothetical protein
VLDWIEDHPGTAAWAQAVVTSIALFIAIWLPLRQHQQTRKDEQEARDRELAGLRLALYTEVRLVAHACLQQLSIAGDAVQTDLRLSRMPLAVFQGNSGKVGLLTAAEIIPLLRLSFVLSDMAGLTSDLPMGAASVRDLETLPKMQATACEDAAEFLAAVPNIPDADTQGFIAELKQAAAQH